MDPRSQSVFQSNYIFGINFLGQNFGNSSLKPNTHETEKVLVFIDFEFHTFKYHWDSFKCHLISFVLCRAQGKIKKGKMERNIQNHQVIFPINWSKFTTVLVRLFPFSPFFSTPATPIWSWIKDPKELNTCLLDISISGHLFNFLYILN